MKFAIEVFGQLRLWEIQSSLPKLKSFLVDNGFEIDTYGTFWNDDYTRNLFNNNKLSFFDKLNLIDEPPFEYGTLKKYYYSLKHSTQQRKQSNKSYDIILQCRSDLNFALDNDAVELLKEFKTTVLSNKDTPTTFINEMTTWRGQDLGPPGFKLDDRHFWSNEKAANLIGSTYDEFIKLEKPVDNIREGIFCYHNFHKVIDHFKLKTIFLDKMFSCANLMRWDILKKLNLKDSEVSKHIQDYNSLLEYYESSNIRTS